MAKLFGPDGIIEIPDESLEEMSRAHAEAEEYIKKAKLEESNDWLFA